MTKEELQQEIDKKMEDLKILCGKNQVYYMQQEAISSDIAHLKQLQVDMIRLEKREKSDKWKKENGFVYAVENCWNCERFHYDYEYPEFSHCKLLKEQTGLDDESSGVDKGSRCDRFKRQERV